MDPVHDKGVHGPGPRRGSMDQGSMFCTLPARFRQKAKFAKKAEIANRASNGRDKSSVKYDPMCYATF